MIKVNLLDSELNRVKGVRAVEQKVANPRMQTLCSRLSSSVCSPPGCSTITTARQTHATPNLAEKAEQERIQSQMVAVNKERTD